jgi:hypothetical protein
VEKISVVHHRHHDGGEAVVRGRGKGKNKMAAETRHLQVRISADKYDALKALAIQTHMSLQGLVEHIIERHLAMDTSKQARDLAGYVNTQDQRLNYFLTHANPELKTVVTKLVDGWMAMVEGVGGVGPNNA